MVVLFAVGFMNLGWTVLLTAVIFAEKITPQGPIIGKAAGLAFVLFGLISLAIALL
jgi:predicted metal-binding membrane protein